MKTNVERADQFLNRAFEDNPSYSFGDPMIMYEHSRTVRDIAMRIADSVECDLELLGVMALFHDIGKAYKADEQNTLHPEGVFDAGLLRRRAPRNDEGLDGGVFSVSFRFVLFRSALFTSLSSSSSSPSR